MEKELIESREGVPLAELDDDAESVQQSGSGSGSGSSSSSSNNLPAPVEEAPSGSPNPKHQPSSSSAPVQPDPTVVAELANLREQVAALTLQNIDLKEQLARAGLGPDVAFGAEAPIGQEENDELEDREEEVAHEVDGAEVDNAELDGGNAELDGGNAELDGGNAELDGGNAELDGGNAELDDANADGHVDVPAENDAEGAVVVAAAAVPCRLVRCTRNLSNEQSRNTHEETKHSNIRPYMCSMPNTADPTWGCNWFFKLEAHVKSHLESVHQAQEIRLWEEFILFPELVRERHEEWQQKLRDAGFL